MEWAAMRLTMPLLRRSATRGGGEPVLVAPGFASDDMWTESIRRLLTTVGYDVRGWGLGRNHGRVPKLIPELVEQVATFAEEAGRPVRLVGWSLGGYLAREVARERPDLVEKVITLGKKGDLSARRRAMSLLGDRQAVKKVFETIAPRYADRPGGYFKGRWAKACGNNTRP